MKIKIYMMATLVLLGASCSFGQLVGMWNFSEGAGENTVSEVGSIVMQRGTSQSTWANPVWYEDGLSGYCFKFENDKGSSENDRDFLTPVDGVDVTPAISAQFTIDAWIKLATIPEGFTTNDPYYVVWAGDKDSVLQNNYFIRLDGWNLRSASLISGFYYDDSGTPTYKRFIHPTKIEPGVWYRVVFSYDASLPSDNAKVWINDTLYAETASEVPITTGYTTPWLIIGAARQTGSHYRCFDGLIDQVRIYANAVQELGELDAGDCNYPGMTKNDADVDGDCTVDLADFAALTLDWMDCTDPTNVACD